MITPALLISACGTLVLSTSNRLSRVVDRVRVLTAEVEVACADGKPTVSSRRVTLITRQLEQLTARALLLRSSMTAIYASIVLLIGTSLSVGVAVLLGWSYAVPIVFALTGAVALFYGSVLLMREAWSAVVSTLAEMEYVRELAATCQERSDG